MKKLFRTFLALALACVVFFNSSEAFAYGEYYYDAEVYLATIPYTTTSEYKEWYADWQLGDNTDSAKIILTPGDSPDSLNFCWYTEEPSIPQIKIGQTPDLSDGTVFTGAVQSILRSNGTITYHGSNKVTATGLQPNTEYYYSYSGDNGATWSDTYSYFHNENEEYDVLLTTDIQIGSSDNYNADTYAWNKLLGTALSITNHPAFLLSAGDQVDYKTATGDRGLRELQYAGLHYPKALRSIPFVPVVGNHDSRCADGVYHYNTPHSTGLGATEAGCDYFFKKGNALFIILNTNNRKQSDHRKLMKEAISTYPDAAWRIVSFHHDVYGSGEKQSNGTASNMRVIFAPLMDEFHIDLAISGHDHTYSRSYCMYDGTAIQYDDNANLQDPMGTPYVTLGCSSGSTVSILANPKQYYVTERTNAPVGSFGVLHVAGDSLQLKMYDINGAPYADTMTIKKNTLKRSPKDLINTCQTAIAQKSIYTPKSYKTFINAYNSYVGPLNLTAEDDGAELVSVYYGTSEDPLTVYGYYKSNNDALPAGFSTLLDKTRTNSPTMVQGKDLAAKHDRLQQALQNLKKNHLEIHYKGKRVHKNTRIKVPLKKRSKLSIQRSEGKLTIGNSASKWISVSKNGVIRAKKYSKKPARITFSLANISTSFIVTVQKPRKKKKK